MSGHTDATPRAEAESNSRSTIRPRIWNPNSSRVPLPKGTAEIVQDAIRPLESPRDALSREYVKDSLNNNMLEVMKWEMMEMIKSENKYNKHIRQFLQFLLGDDPENADLELINHSDALEEETLNQLIDLVQESLSKSDEFLYRISDSRDKIAFSIEQKSQLKRRMEKAVNMRRK